MARKGENIYKRKDGRWEGRFIKGRRGSKIQYGYVYAKTYRETREKLLKAKEQLIAASLQKPVKKDRDRLREIFPLWLETTTKGLKDSTRIKYQYLYESYLASDLGNYRMCELSEDRVKSLVARLFSSGGKNGTGISGKTISDAVRVLKNVIRFASIRNYPVDNSALEVTVRITPKQLKILSVHEQEKLIDYIQKNPTNSNLGILLSLFTGIRIGELCALKWKDINLTEHTIHIQRTMQRLKSDDTGSKTQIIFSRPKSTCSERDIPLPDIVSRLFKHTYDPDFYFLSGSGKYFVEPRTLQYRFDSVLKQCGIPHVSFHTLRHTFATRCVEIGFDLKSLSEILGHANVNITLNRYVHPSFDIKAQNMRRLSEVFSAYSCSTSCNYSETTSSFRRNSC